ncbi:hypothetical protein COT78_03190 [Candidatus Berkelbacteria bacterium CG10_big_fil_rev_8_21_14_0_10_43_13]|uniref:Non-canonical purine NTP pyrophosphatase n=1 Tax=Candidatus Berkelbacteria bacterium CG10_big_fil_rev_8_21_14_0_10_43_13 TaxID=1974514 RepID=A0A2H0W5Z3_9BACT|nr:MAG: hypothetical protein COT78_03190 [Candidatus Berkelbacteria bacterium CG10_big_fil_rev_8_21_14_0_10_43_13]
MKEITYITSNHEKSNEAKLIAARFDINLIPNLDLGIDEIKSLDQSEVSEAAAKRAFAILHQPLITDDAGLYIENLNQFPGAYTKFLFQTIGVSGLWRIINQDCINATWKCFLTYIDDTRIITSIGQLKGQLRTTQNPESSKASNYDSIFFPEKYDKPLQKLSLTEKSTISHRKAAFTTLFEKLNKDD